MNENDGGPAFPQTNEQRYEDPIHGVIRPSDISGDAHPGMSLRDYIAIKAMAAYLTSPVTAQDATDRADKCAEWSYIQADEMLKERAK